MYFHFIFPLSAKVYFLKIHFLEKLVTPLMAVQNNVMKIIGINNVFNSS